MKVKKIKVPYYKWTVISITMETYKDKDIVLKKMKSLKMLPEDIKNISNMADDEAINGAVCHYNDGRLTSVIIVLPHSDSVQLVSTLIHEGRHATDRIIELNGLEGLESAAYLNEYITTELIKDYIKDETYKTKG